MPKAKTHALTAPQERYFNRTYRVSVARADGKPLTGNKLARFCLTAMT